MLPLIYGFAFTWLAYACWQSGVTANKTVALASVFIALQNLALSPPITLS